MINIKRYLVFLFVSIMLILLMAFVLNDFKGFYLLIFVDLHALVAILLLPLIIMLMKYRISEIKNFIISVFKKSLTKDDYEKAYIFFKFKTQVVIGTGVFICIFSLISMMRNLSVENMGRCLGTGLCGLLYSVLIVVFILLPVRMVLKDSVKRA